jgi:hypothetical protein
VQVDIGGAALSVHHQRQQARPAQCFLARLLALLGVASAARSASAWANTAPSAPRWPSGSKTKRKGNRCRWSGATATASNMAKTAPGPGLLRPGLLGNTVWRARMGSAATTNPSVRVNSTTADLDMPRTKANRPPPVRWRARLSDTLPCCPVCVDAITRSYPGSRIGYIGRSRPS